MNADRSGDPNFPLGLQIHPSSLQRSTRPFARPWGDTEHVQQITGALAAAAKDTQAVSDSASWEQDTAQDIEDYGIAGRIWEAAYLLACYLRPAHCRPGELEFDPPCSLFDRPISAPITVVELGSGAGYGSLHLARQLERHAKTRPAGPCQARLVLTDLENVVPLMVRNVARAGYQQASETIDVRVRSLAWGNEEHASSLISELSADQRSGSAKPTGNPITHILCSDLVYFPELLSPLLRSIISLSTAFASPDDAHSTTEMGPELIISYKIRSLTKEQPFWSALGSWFDFQAVDSRLIPGQTPSTNTLDATDGTVHTWHRFGSEAQDYAATAGSDQELFVFVGHRRKETIGCLAPESDADLMHGKRLRPCVERLGEWGPRHVLESPSSGQDYFEWLLLSKMQADLG